MNCKKCGYPLFSNDKVCKRCGEEVVRESDIPEVTEEKANTEVPIAPVVGDGGKLDSSTPIVDPTKPAAPTNGAPIPELATLDAPPKVFEEPKEEVKDVIPTVEEPVDPKEAPIPDLNNIPDPTKEVEEKVEETVPEQTEAPEEVKQEINTGAIPDPTKPQEEVKEEVKEVELPNINNGPIEPVVGKEAEEKKTSSDASYDKIEGPKSLSSFMSLMGVGPKEEKKEEVPEEQPQEQPPEEEYKIDVTRPIEEISYDTKEENKVANVNQTLPSLPNDKKSSSSVVIPKKPEPINNGNSNNTNIPKQNNPEMDNYQQQMNNYDESKANEPVNNNQQQVFTEQKKKKNPIVIILVLIILGVGGYFGYKYLKDSGILSGDGKTNTVEFSSYKFKVPEKYKTQINTNNLVVYDDTNILAFAFINGSYSEFSSALTLENFNSLGNKATYLGEKEQDGSKYHLYQVVVGEKNAYVGYVAKGDVKIICFSVEPKTGSTLPSDAYLKEALKIALSAEFSGSSNVVESSGTNENVETSETVEAGSQALTGEASSAGDVDDEPVYEDTYVNITLNEINE